MNVDAFLAALRADPAYADQIVHVHEEPARAGEPAAAPAGWDCVKPWLTARGIPSLHAHQAEALDAVAAGRDVVVATGTASGKSLCYILPILRVLGEDPAARALLLFPAKALCQNQFSAFRAWQEVAGRLDRLSGVYDGDTPSELRRRLRDHGGVVFSNPDMLHAGILPQHGRWADFFANLRLLVLDELHVYSGIFGANVAQLLRRLRRVCRHYGSDPLVVACSATIANPAELFERIAGRTAALVDRDASPRGRRVFVLWNPPRVRDTTWHSRRSANVEAHELMARLVSDGVPTIVFSKAKVTAELIHRYAVERLRATAPDKAPRIAAYRGGYLATERRDIERRLFTGELLGVSTTPALELGIDVGGLDAGILVGYPGTRASFFQQAGRAGRKAEDAVVFLVGLDTSINQYILTHPEYLFDRCVEQGVVEPDNPFVITGHLRCATHELPLPVGETGLFGPHADLVLNVLNDNGKVRSSGGAWHHAATETPQHEVSLRDPSTGVVVLQDGATGATIGQIDRLDAQPLLHPHAIYLQHGETWRVRVLDLERNLAVLDRVDTDYYTQPLGGTDVHHIDRRLREKPLGAGQVCWGEVTAYFRTFAYQKIHFYTLDVVSTHPLQVPTLALDTLAVWIIPPASLLDAVRAEGLDAHSGLRGIGYATRMLLPLFLTCDTLDFSHSVGSANSPWQAVFIYERYPWGQGFTERAWQRMHEILPAVREGIRDCPCEAGCPCCVGKPLRQHASWNVELWEASIPSKAAALMILDGLLAPGVSLAPPDAAARTDGAPGERVRLEQSLRRRLERMREPQVFHPIVPAPALQTGHPAPEPLAGAPTGDAQRRGERRRAFERDLGKRLAKRLGLGGLPPAVRKVPLPPGMSTPHGNLTPRDFPGRPAPPTAADEPPIPAPPTARPAADAVRAGDALAARARRLRRGEGPAPS